MNTKDYDKALKRLKKNHKAFLAEKNKVDEKWYNGIYQRYVNPVVTAEHAPIEWRYDLNSRTNPFLQERLGVNCALNPGAIEWNGKILLVVRTEGYDRKSFFAIAESKTGTEGFKFWDEPVDLPETTVPDTNVYDMRLTRHEDGWVYGTFCSERKDPNVPAHDTSSAVAACGIVRTKDLLKWERLPDLKTRSSQQRNVVLHPEFVNGKYAFYTRPQDGFIDTGSGGGIGWAYSDTMENASIGEETIIDPRVYHTIKEVKNGQGPVPIKTKKGWLHLAHGVRNTAAGLRYVLYVFITSLDEPWKVLHRPGGYFLAPQGDERIGDVSNVTFSNGWVQRSNGQVFIYYGASDTRINVAVSSVERLLDYAINTPEDGYTTRKSVDARLSLIRKNAAYLAKAGKAKKA